MEFPPSVYADARSRRLKGLKNNPLLTSDINNYEQFPIDEDIPTKARVPAAPAALTTGNTIHVPSPLEKLQATIDSMPNREDYKPSTGRKILGIALGGLAGAGGHTEVGREIVNAPYRRAMEDFGSKYGKAKTKYDLEVNLNKSKSDAEQQQIENEQKNKELGIKERETGVKEYEAESPDD